ncbi:MAG TPA: NAD(P)H-dependent oxidoreductase [Kiritimatiellia bacterium]|nr:NAD(P)H-dependent oxidoreductase [Kiritimatiellia bacterium]
MRPRILAIGGALRRESFNQKLAVIAAEGARAAGAEVTLAVLREYPMPLYDADLEAEQGLPETVRQLKKLFVEHHGLILASPEYNTSMTGVFKNAIDWVSRSETKEETPLAAIAGKTVVLCAASPGALGGLRGLIHVRAMLSSLGANVLPDQVTVNQAHKAFSPDGRLVDEKLDARVRGLGATLARHLGKLLA